MSFSSEELPLFARMIIERQKERSSVASFQSEAPSGFDESFEENCEPQNENSEFDVSVDLSTSILCDETEQLLRFQEEIQALRRENKELKNQNAVLSMEIRSAEDKSELDALQERLNRAIDELNEEKSKRQVAEDEILLLKNDLMMRTKELEAKRKLMESLTLKVMDLEERLRGAPKTQMAQKKDPIDLTDRELQDEIAVVSAKFKNVCDQLDRIDINDPLADKLEEEFSSLSKRLKRLELEQKQRK